MPAQVCLHGGQCILHHRVSISTSCTAGTSALQSSWGRWWSCSPCQDHQVGHHESGRCPPLPGQCRSGYVPLCSWCRNAAQLEPPCHTNVGALKVLDKSASAIKAAHVLEASAVSCAISPCDTTGLSCPHKSLL